MAIKYLVRVLALEKNSLGDFSAVGSTYLNISSVLSDMGRHQASFEFAKKAKSVFIGLAQQEQSDPSADPENDQFRVNLAVAFFNMGFNLERLGRMEDARDTYKQGYLEALDGIGGFHHLTQKLEKKYHMALAHTSGERLLEKRLDLTHDLLGASKDSALDAYPSEKEKKKDYLKTRFFLNTSQINCNLKLIQRVLWGKDQ